MTAEPDFILPIALSVMFAVWVGDKCNHGIYHRLIDLASFLPWLVGLFTAKDSPATCVVLLSSTIDDDGGGPAFFFKQATPRRPPPSGDFRRISCKKPKGQ